jgi:hypothetical protein
LPFFNRVRFSATSAWSAQGFDFFNPVQPEGYLRCCRWKTSAKPLSKEKAMEKLLAIFSVFILAVPLYAAEGDPNVVVTCTDEGGGVFKVSYAVQVDTQTGDPGLARGFALNIEVSGNATITSVSDYDMAGTATVPRTIMAYLSAKLTSAPIPTTWMTGAVR